MRRFGHDVQRHNLDVSATNPSSFGGVYLEPITLAQLLGRAIVGSGGQVIVAAVRRTQPMVKPHP